MTIATPHFRFKGQTAKSVRGKGEDAKRPLSEKLKRQTRVRDGSRLHRGMSNRSFGLSVIGDSEDLRQLTALAASCGPSRAVSRYHRTLLANARNLNSEL